MLEHVSPAEDDASGEVKGPAPCTHGSEGLRWHSVADNVHRFSITRKQQPLKDISPRRLNIYLMHYLCERQGSQQEPTCWVGRKAQPHSQAQLSSSMAFSLGLAPHKSLFNEGAWKTCSMAAVSGKEAEIGLQLLLRLFFIASTINWVPFIKKCIRFSTV